MISGHFVKAKLPFLQPLSKNVHITSKCQDISIVLKMDPIYTFPSALYFYVQPLRRQRQTVLGLLCSGLRRLSCQKS